MSDRFGSVRPIPHTRRRMAAISAYRTTGIDVPLPSGCAPSWAKCDLPRSPGLHASARGLCCFLEREGLFDRQLQRAGGREMHEVADRAGNFGSAGPAAELGGPKPLDGRLFKNEIAWVYDHRLVGHSAEGHELAAFSKHVQQLPAFLSADRIERGDYRRSARHLLDALLPAG